MSSISVRLEEDTDQLLERLKNIQNVDKAGIMNAIAEGLRTSTEERFQSQETPEGVKWKESHRAREKGGKTLIRTSDLRTSIKTEADSTGLAIGTNLIYAATHQFGDERTIRAKNGKYLKFKIGNKFVSKQSGRVNIPARPFLGISEKDDEEIREILEDVVREN